MPAKRLPKKRSQSSQRQSVMKNKQAMLKTYHTLKKKIDRSWTKLRTDYKKKAPVKVTMKNVGQLLLLLGECNYMARECMRLSRRSR